MTINTTTSSLTKVSADLLLIRLFEGEQRLDPKIKELDASLGGQISQVLKRGDFKGQNGETCLLGRVLLVGLGKRAEYNLERLRTAMASAAPLIQKFKVSRLAVALIKSRPRGATVKGTVQALVETLLLSNYHFVEYKNLKPDEQPAVLQNLELVLNEPRDKARVAKTANMSEALSRAVIFARDLGNHPGNVATPSHLAKHALDLAKENKRIKVKILDRADMKKERMAAVLAVAAGSDEEPKFIILEYLGKRSAPRIVLVGKGITFDSGGISLKPGEKMEEMKFDMAGAATVMGIIKAAAALKLPLNLVGLVPATENLPSGKAVKPGDIIRSRSGKTIEIINTDAEGRLVLADALDYAKKYQPALVMDFATLTGAIVSALGDDIAGAFTNTDKLLPQLKAAAAVTGEKIWPMPLEPDYDQFIKSDFADLRNIGSQRFGDAINGANFLRQFVDYPWIHLDIAGTAWATREKPYRPKGATGTGVRLAIEFLKHFKAR